MIILDDSSSSQEGDEGHYLSIGVTTSAGTSPSATPGDHIPTTDTQQARARNAISRRVKVDRSTSPNGEKDDEEYVPGGSDNPEDNNSKNSRYNLRPSRMTAKGQLRYDYEEGEETGWEDSRHLMTSSPSTTPGKPSKTGKTRKRHKTKKEKQEKKERKRKEEENWKSQVAILQHQLNSLQHPQQQSPSYPHYQPQSLHQPLPLPQQHQQQPPPLPYPLHPTQYQPHMNLDELIYREEATFDNFVGSQLAYQPMPQHQMQQQQLSPQQTHQLQQQPPPLQQPLQQDWQQQQQLYNGYQAQPMSVGGEGRASLLGVEVGQPPQQTSTFRVKDTQDLLYSAG